MPANSHGMNKVTVLRIGLNFAWRRTALSVSLLLLGQAKLKKLKRNNTCTYDHVDFCWHMMLKRVIFATKFIMCVKNSFFFPRDTNTRESLGVEPLGQLHHRYLHRLSRWAINALLVTVKDSLSSPADTNRVSSFSRLVTSDYQIHAAVHATDRWLVSLPRVP